MPSTDSYVAAAAARVELPIDPRYLDAVEADFERAAAMAKFLMEFPLDEEVQAAPIFRP